LLRSVEPELADHLPADDPRAIRFRRDLRRLNAMVMNDRLVARVLAQACGDAVPCVVADLGTGDGTLMLRAARRLAPRWRDVTVLLVDQQDIVSAETRDGFAALHWNVQTVAADVFDFLERPGPELDLIFANAFLHHFTAERLARLFEAAAKRTRLVVACEPRRSRLAREASRLLGLLGYGEVVVQDAVTSIKAGFVGTEMTQCWSAAGFHTEERDAGPFMHLFTAKRAAG
jgi:hypothetical protein